MIVIDLQSSLACSKKFLLSSTKSPLCVCRERRTNCENFQNSDGVRVFVFQYFQDSSKVVDRHKSGFQPPGDLPFEDLSSAHVAVNHNTNTPKSSVRGGIGKGTFSSGKSKKRAKLFGVFSNPKVLPTLKCFFPCVYVFLDLFRF